MRTSVCAGGGGGEAGAPEAEAAEAGGAAADALARTLERLGAEAAELASVAGTRGARVAAAAEAACALALRGVTDRLDAAVAEVCAACEAPGGGGAGARVGALFLAGLSVRGAAAGAGGGEGAGDGGMHIPMGAGTLARGADADVAARWRAGGAACVRAWAGACARDACAELLPGLRCLRACAPGGGGGDGGMHIPMGGGGAEAWARAHAGWASVRLAREGTGVSEDDAARLWTPAAPSGPVARCLLAVAAAVSGLAGEPARGGPAASLAAGRAVRGAAAGGPERWRGARLGGGDGGMHIPIGGGDDVLALARAELVGAAFARIVAEIGGALDGGAQAMPDGAVLQVCVGPGWCGGSAARLGRDLSPASGAAFVCGKVRVCLCGLLLWWRFVGVRRHFHFRVVPVRVQALLDLACARRCFAGGGGPGVASTARALEELCGALSARLDFVDWLLHRPLVEEHAEVRARAGALGA